MSSRTEIRDRMWASLLLAGFPLLACSTPLRAQPGQACAANPQQFAATYNYVLGTQAFGTGRSLGPDTSLPAQAQAIRTLGSNVLKISLGRRQAGEYGFRDEARRASTALQYVDSSSGMKQVLDMDFAYYQLWVQTFADSNWRDGVSAKEAKSYYREMYDLTSWILARYVGTGKVFLLGNWEGDWLLNGRQGGRSTPPKQAIEGMIDWLNIRQKAIDDAKAATEHDGVEVYHYVEVNLVKRAMEGEASVALSVLPETNVDLISYSSYEAIKRSRVPDIASIREPLARIVQFLERQLKPKAGLPFDRRVFIGEYGYHAAKAKPPTVEQQYLKSRYVMQVAIEQDLPFTLIWQLYNNEYAPDGTSKEMSLIDESGHRRALYYLHQQYLSSMSAFVADTCRRTGKAPIRKAFKARALDVLAALTFEKMQQMADHGQQTEAAE